MESFLLQAGVIDETEYRFYILSGRALETLNIAARQADVDLVFDSEIVAGVRTPYLSGRYTVDEVFGRLLKSSGLELFCDSESGTYAIIRAKRPSSGSLNLGLAEASVQSESDGFLSHAIELLSRKEDLGGSGGVFDDVVDLSPFLIETFENSYVATSTLASTRVRTNLSNVGSSISIITDRMIGDLVGTNAGDLLGIIPNVEVAGELGNYTSAGVHDNVYHSTTSRISGNQQRIRGLANAQVSRNFFQTKIPFDTYNVSQVTVNRGPNSVLFGLGSPGGIIESNLKMPYSTDFTEINVQFSYFGGFRGSLDVNRALMNGRLKLRFAVLNEDRKYRQEEAFRKDNRQYLTWDVLLRESRSTFVGDTTIRGYLEFGEIDKNPPDIVPPSKYYGFWYDLSEYQKIIGNYPGIDNIEDLLPIFRTINQGGYWRPKATIINFDRDTYWATRNQTAMYGHLTLVVNDVNALSTGVYGYDGFMGRALWDEPRKTQDYKFTSGEHGLSGFSAPTLMNRKQFDFVDHLFSGRTDDMRDEFEVKEVSIDQKLLDGNMGIEVSFNKQSLTSYRFNPYSTGRGRRIAIDISEYLTMPEKLGQDIGFEYPAMRTNPNLGRMVVQKRMYAKHRDDHEFESLRLTAFFKHDFRNSLKSIWGDIIGFHSISYLKQAFEDKNRSIMHRLNWDSDDVDLSAANTLNGSYNSSSRTVNSFVYVSDSAMTSISGDDVKVKLPFSSSALPDVGHLARFVYWDNDTKQHREISAYPSWVPHAYYSTIDSQKVVSDAFIHQGYWFNEHLVLLFAIRDDDVRNFEVIPAGKVDQSNGSMNLTDFRLQDKPSFSRSGLTRTKSIVWRYPESWLGSLPYESDFRLTYFDSEAFQPSGIGRRLDGSIVDHPRGYTQELGVGLDILDKRISFRVNWFETELLNVHEEVFLRRIDQWVGSGQGWANRLALYEMTGGKVSDIIGASEAGFTHWDQLYSAVEKVIPDYFRNQLTLDFDRDSATNRSLGIEGLTSTYGFISKGLEFEVTGSITDRWNLIFNIAKQETTQTDTLPEVLSFVLEVEENLKRLRLYDVADSPAFGGANTTYGQRWGIEAMSPVLDRVSRDGQRSHEQRKWRWNLMTSYHFDDGAMSGVAIGAVARWQDESAIGYPKVYNENDRIVNDVKNPFHGPSEFNADCWISYRKSFANGLKWKIQLNIRNLIGGGDNYFIPISINPIGDVQAIRTSPERQILLTNTFRF